MYGATIKKILQKTFVTLPNI